jgi:hypothetical protein
MLDSNINVKHICGVAQLSYYAVDVHMYLSLILNTLPLLSLAKLVEVASNFISPLEGQTAAQCSN